MKRYLILDCDGVIFKSPALIDEQVKKIKYEASDEYYQELIDASERLNERLNEWEQERSNDEEEKQSIDRKLAEIARLRQEHWDYKDQVLEEVFEKYKNLIDYNRIFVSENTYEGVISLINYIWASKVFDDIIILSHVNTQTEIDAKERYFHTYLPMVKTVFPKFHEDSYFYPETMEKRKEKRPRTNKIEYLKKLYNIDDLSESIFIDDTEGIIKEAAKADVGHCYHRDKNMNSAMVILRAFEDFCAIHEKGKSKTKRK